MEFKEWLNTYAQENQVNLNNIFNFKNKDGETRKISVEQIFEYINQAQEKEQSKFKASLELGAEKKNIYGFMYNASKAFKIEHKEDIKQEAKEKDETWIEKQEKIKDNIEKAFEGLGTKIKDPNTAKDGFKLYNEFISQFSTLHSYSYNNNKLIFGQLKGMGISLGGAVKSEKDWNELGVEIKGKPLYINIPTIKPKWEMETVKDEFGLDARIFKLDADGNKIQAINTKGEKMTETHFSLSGKVYDVSQTDAFEKGFKKADSKDGVMTKVNIKENFFKVFSAELEHMLNVKIDVKPLQSAENGSYAYVGGVHQISIDNSNNRPLENQFATLLHEVGHVIMHKQDSINGARGKRVDKSFEKKEAEAESFAYVVGKQFGLEIPSGRYMLPYLQSGKIELNDVLEDVYKAVKEFNKRIDTEHFVNSFKLYEDEKENIKDVLKEIKEVDRTFIEDIKVTDEEILKEVENSKPKRNKQQ